MSNSSALNEQLLAKSALSPEQLLRAAKEAKATKRPIWVFTVPEGEFVVIHCPPLAGTPGNHPKQPTYAGNAPESMQSTPGLLEDIGGRTFVEVSFCMGECPCVIYEPHRRWLFVTEDTTERWEGIVLDVQEDALTVRLTDPTGKVRDIEGEIPIREVTERDLPHAKEGAVFDIFFDVSENEPPGKREIVFRKEQWTEEDLRKAQEEARSIRERLGWR